MTKSNDINQDFLENPYFMENCDTYFLLQDDQRFTQIDGNVKHMIWKELNI